MKSALSMLLVALVGSASAADPACTGGCAAYELCTSTHGCCLAPGDAKEATCTLPSGTVMRLNFEAASEPAMAGACPSGTFVGLYDSVRQLNTALTCAAEFPRTESVCPMYRGAWKIHTAVGPMMFKGWNDALNATCIAPAPSAGPTPPPAPQPAPRKDALKITVTQDSTWSGGYCRGFVVQNTGATGVGAGWRLQFTLPTGAQITKSWNGASSRSGNTVTVTPPDWAALLPAGVSANPFGFCASSSGGEPSDVQIILPTSSSSRRLVGATNRNTAANALTVDTHYDSTWDEGFCVTFEVKNQGAQTVQNYKLHFQLPNGASITKSWNGQVVSSTGGAIVVQPPTFAAALAPGAESNPFGFCAAGVGRLSQISAF